MWRGGKTHFCVFAIRCVVCGNLLLLFVVNATCPKMFLCVWNSFRCLPQLVVVVCYCFFNLNVTWQNECLCVCNSLRCLWQFVVVICCCFCFFFNVTWPKMLLCVCNSFRCLPQLVVVVCYCFFLFKCDVEKRILCVFVIRCVVCGNLLLLFVVVICCCCCCFLMRRDQKCFCVFPICFVVCDTSNLTTPVTSHLTTPHHTTFTNLLRITS